MSSLSCNFIKYKQETISKVEWSISYSSVSTNFFVSHYENGQKDVPTSPYFTVEGASSGEKVVRMMVNDDRSKQVNICCKVEAVRDSGYGMLKKVDSEKCSQVGVIPGDKVQELTFFVSDDLVKVGGYLQYTCRVG
ncbi:uncharacterized protein LOC111716042 isoform X1 [Eurytemora carolleeae]|uniref:uncharacterized protein LOC111716042 isoform X1 n=1 Tax=Eurytemora carolleeae TaxID=1294199 RepID=UPI000C777825|nr:uncharacterized protein LOC111716042 isoform X1 [Eurytemora carolleeae]|eukprot:XP_023347222.1 uncharacterized protein LOC111716042 isoform X1 [Eurytemora affinis]